jgi:hypothetical protein
MCTRQWTKLPAIKAQFDLFGSSGPNSEHEELGFNRNHLGLTLLLEYVLFGFQVPRLQ